MLYYYDYKIPRNSFFAREVSFTRFGAITEERREEIKELIKKFFEDEEDKKTDINRYMKVLEFLGSAGAHVRMPSFDEQVLFFILACDPDLVYLKTYLNMGIISVKEIEAAPKSKKRKLEKARSEQLHNFTGSMREQMGFYDSKLLKYESVYFDEIVKYDGLVSNFKGDATTSLLRVSKLVRTFESVTDEEFERIKMISQEYQDSVEDPNSIHTLSYNILAKKRKVNLGSLKAKFVLLIHTIDPELKMLQIYEEESNVEEIERRVIEEFGYYDMELIRLERLYHLRFCPDKVISAWSDERKLLWTQN